MKGTNVFASLGRRRAHTVLFVDTQGECDIFYTTTTAAIFVRVHIVTSQPINLISLTSNLSIGIGHLHFDRFCQVPHSMFLYPLIWNILDQNVSWFAGDCSSAIMNAIMWVAQFFFFLNRFWRCCKLQGDSFTHSLHYGAIWNGFKFPIKFSICCLKTDACV